MRKTVKEFRGVRDVVYAEVLADTVDAYETGPVKSLARISQIAREVATSSETKFYDNEAALVISARGADTTTLNTSVIDLETLADITGQYYDPTTGALIDLGVPSDKYYALGYVLGTAGAEGDEELYVWKYKVKFSQPSEESATKDDGTDASGQEVECTAVNTTHQFVKTGKSAMGLTVDAGKGLAALGAFFATVTTPDTLAPKETP